jgi:hypothetical protein
VRLAATERARQDRGRRWAARQAAAPRMRPCPEEARPSRRAACTTYVSAGTNTYLKVMLSSPVIAAGAGPAKMAAQGAGSGLAQQLCSGGVRPAAGVFPPADSRALLGDQRYESGVKLPKRSAGAAESGLSGIQTLPLWSLTLVEGVVRNGRPQSTDITGSTHLKNPGRRTGRRDARVALCPLSILHAAGASRVPGASLAAGSGACPRERIELLGGTITMLARLRVLQAGGDRRVQPRQVELHA